MASEATVLSKDGQWKIEVEAWKNDFLFYKSIGAQVTVYHREATKNIWGTTKTDWVERKTSSITIRNIYHGMGHTIATREKTCHDASQCELKEWAVGVKLTIPVDKPTDVGGNAVLDIQSVDGLVTVQIAAETLTASVSASSALSDNSIW